MMSLVHISRFNESMARTIPLMFAAILMTGCAAPMVSTKEELQSLSENEGVVIGSILFIAEKGVENESAWAFLRGRRSDDVEWIVSFGELGLNPFATTYAISAKPGKEEVFIKKLPPGNYNIQRASPAGFFGLSSNQYVSLAIYFRVAPRQTSYIGKLVVNLPDRIMAGSPVRVAISDSQEGTVEKLRSEHSSILGNTVKDLATVRTMR
ncbi:MAG: hypothetical protein ACREYF_05730 [Gammaproteobacteria bacterium]